MTWCGQYGAGLWTPNEALGSQQEAKEWGLATCESLHTADPKPLSMCLTKLCSEHPHLEKPPQTRLYNSAPLGKT